MTRAKLILPSGAMPWGRWVEQNLDEIQSAIAVQIQDSSSTGSLFSSRADLLQRQIADIPSIAAIYQRDLPPFSVTRVQNPTATAYVYDSAVQTFNPPRPDRAYDYNVIAVMDVSGLNLPFSRSLIRTNGVENMFQHENMHPGFQTRATYSILGSGSIAPGETVSVQCAVAVSQSGTLTFNSTQLWCTFTGSIL